MALGKQEFGELGKGTSVNIEGKCIFLDDNIELPYNLKEKDLSEYIYKINKANVRKRHIPIHIFKTLGMYSVGERKLVTFRILSNLDFEILLIDEYLTNIDKTNLEEVYNILDELKDRDTLIIISTNDENVKDRYPLLIGSVISIYLISKNKYEYLILFIAIFIETLVSFFNAAYTFNLKKSLIEEMNIYKKSIYVPIYIWGIINYLPIMIMILFYTIKNYRWFGIIGVLTILNEIIYIILLKRNGPNKIVYFIATYLIITISILAVFMMALHNLL